MKEYHPPKGHVYDPISGKFARVIPSDNPFEQHENPTPSLKPAAPQIALRILLEVQHQVDGGEWITVQSSNIPIEVDRCPVIHNFYDDISMLVGLSPQGESIFPEAEKMFANK